MNKQVIERCLELARHSITKNGGPFGAIIVRNGRIIAEGTNCVVNHHDPTAHAEIVAIREACQQLNTHILDECEIYCSCEPCPMCLSAIYWARLKKVYYSASREDAANVGFDDAYIYEELSLNNAQRALNTFQVLPEQGKAVLDEWLTYEGKIPY
jgi:guanine deaminase